MTPTVTRRADKLPGMSSRIPLPAPLDRAPFARHQALALGVGKKRVDGRDLLRPFHGVRHPASVPLTFEAQCRAFFSRMPGDAFFCSVTAARLMGLPLPFRLERDPRLHVAVPSPRHASTARGVVGHKVKLAGDDVRQWHGLPLSSPTRTWCELGAELSLADLVAGGDYLIDWRMPFCSVAELESAVAAYPGRRGKPILAAALPLLNDHSESPQESRMRVLLASAGIAGLVANLWITVRGRRYRADVAIPRHKLLLEYQSEYHNDTAQWRKDMTKREVLATAGWYTMDVNADDLNNGVEFVERVKVVITSRAAAP